jgi:hypothetical protein
MRNNPLVGFRYAIIPIDTGCTGGFPGASAEGGEALDKWDESGSREAEARNKTTRNDAISGGSGSKMEWAGEGFKIMDNGQ